MFAEERKQQILSLLARTPAVRIADLRRALRVSPASVRRDLADLERSGLLKRTHGGAVSNRLMLPELSLAEKEDRFHREKTAIAEIAGGLIVSGDAVFLDAGSTTRQIARVLRHRRDVTVVTNGLNVAWELASSDVELILTGGHVRSGILSQVGPMAERSISSVHVDKLFLAANGVDLVRGVTTPNLLEAQAKRAMIESASQVVLVADSSKFGRVAFGHICGLERLQAVVTDARVPRRTIGALEDLGIAVHIAPGRTAAAIARGSNRA